MGNGKGGSSAGSSSVTRPHYLAGTYLSADTCSLEQNYRLQRLRRHNRNMHGWGVVCGLWVASGGDPSHPWGVQVCPGYALGPQGDEIELRSPALLDVREFLWYRPAAQEERVAYLTVRYDDQPDELQPIPGFPCDCSDPVYGGSRQADSFALGIMWTLPQLPLPAGMCKPESAPCLPCPNSPWLVLAAIHLPAEGVQITQAMIDNGIRTTL